MNQPDKACDGLIASLDRYIAGDREWLNGIVLIGQVSTEIRPNPDYYEEVEKRYIPVIRRYLQRLLPIARGEIRDGSYYPSTSGAINHLQSVLDTARDAGVSEHDAAYVNIVDCISQLQKIK